MPLLAVAFALVEPGPPYPAPPVTLITHWRSGRGSLDIYGPASNASARPSAGPTLLLRGHGGLRCRWAEQAVPYAAETCAAATAGLPLSTNWQGMENHERSVSRLQQTFGAK